MLAPLLGSISGERILIYLFSRGEGYAREIARFFNTDLSPIQKKLGKLEASGILSSRLAGKTRLYSINPRYPFKTEIENLLQKALTFYPPNEREALLMNRRRPRRSGKLHVPPIDSPEKAVRASIVHDHRSGKEVK